MYMKIHTLALAWQKPQAALEKESFFFCDGIIQLTPKGPILPAKSFLSAQIAAETAQYLR